MTITCLVAWTLTDLSDYLAKAAGWSPGDDVSCGVAGASAQTNYEAEEASAGSAGVIPTPNVSFCYHRCLACAYLSWTDAEDI
jgi:hypothetical protein